MLKHSEKYWVPFSTLKIDELDHELSSSSKEAVITAVEIKGSIEEGQQKKNAESIVPENYLQYTNVGVFRGDKLIGYLGIPEAAGYKYLTNNVSSTVVEMPCNKNHKDVTELIHTETMVRGKVQKNKPSIHVQVNAEANIAELQCQADLLNLDVIHTLEKKTEQTIRFNIDKALQKAQKQYHTDIFSFGEKIHHSNPKEWKKIEGKWPQVFSSLPVEVDVKVRIRNFGKVNRSAPSLQMR
jgi:spore germination protein KC